MEILTLIIAILSLIPIYFLVKGRIKKHYKFDIDYKNITFALFSSPKSPKIDKRYCLIIYVLRIVNNYNEPSTIKDVKLSYKYNGKIFQDESYVVTTGTTPPEGKPAIITSNGQVSLFMMGWDNIRPKLGKHEILQPGGVFSGSAIFLFESQITDLHHVSDLKLTVTDYQGNKLTYKLPINKDWFKLINDRIAVINRAFTVNNDNSFTWK
jgi:hypothetical protein